MPVDTFYADHAVLSLLGYTGSGSVLFVGCLAKVSGSSRRARR